MPLDKVKHPYPESLFVPNLVSESASGSFNRITALSTVIASPLGTAAIGTSTTVARADHVHSSTIPTAISVPRVNFTGGTSTISALALSDGTLSFESTLGQLFSITNSLTGVIFSVNDISGIPVIEVTDAGLIRFNETYGQAVFGATSAVANTQISAVARTTTTIPIVARGVASQSANLQEWQSSTPTTVASMSVAGALTLSSTISASGLAGSLLSSTAGAALGTASAGSLAVPARADHVHPTTGLALLAGATFTGQIQSTLANSTTTGGGQIYLNGATGNRIDFNTNGAAAPAFTTRSAGTKVTLYPTVDASNVDYALGIETNNMWFSTPQATGSFGFKFYAGTTNIATLTGAGALTLSSTISASGLAGSLLSTTNPVALGTASFGSSAIPSRQDHVHPTTGLALLSGATFTGNISAPVVIGGTGTAIGSAGLVVNGTTGDNDSQLIIKKPSQSSVSIMAWDGTVFYSANIYYENGAWVHSAPSGNTNNQLFVQQPGTGVNWYASNNSTGSWNVANNITLWNDSGTWRSTIDSTSTIIGPAATTSIASLRLPHGTAPTSPTNGDIWTTTAGLFVRVNGTTVGPVGTGGGSGTVTSIIAGTGLTGGTITTSGTIAIDTTVVPRLTAANTFTVAPLQLTIDNAANKGIIIRAASSQTANLEEWQNSAGTVLASMSSAGAFTAVSKSFDISHPTKENMRLRYGSLEGPENGVYIRGKTRDKIIALPDYWTGLVDSDSITVQLTAVGIGTVYVDFVANNSIKVGGTAEEFYYFIQAERKDVDKLIVEY